MYYLCIDVSLRNASRGVSDRSAHAHREDRAADANLSLRRFGLGGFCGDILGLY